MTKKEVIKYSIIGVVVILFIVLLFTVVRSLRNRELSTHDELIQSKDATIEAIKHGRYSDSLLIIEKDKNISQLLIADSIRDVNYRQSQNVYNRINEKIRNIPVYVDRIGNNDDSIRTAYSSFR